LIFLYVSEVSASDIDHGLQQGLLIRVLQLICHLQALLLSAASNAALLFRNIPSTSVQILQNFRQETDQVSDSRQHSMSRISDKNQIFTNYKVTLIKEYLHPAFHFFVD